MRLFNPLNEVIVSIRQQKENSDLVCVRAFDAPTPQVPFVVYPSAQVRLDTVLGLDVRGDDARATPRLLTRDLYISKVADLDSRSGLSRGPDGLVVGFRRFGIAR